MTGRRPPPRVDLGGIDKQRRGRDGADGATGATGPAGADARDGGAAMAAHLTSPDPHPMYQSEAEADARYGLPSARATWSSSVPLTAAAARFVDWHVPRAGVITGAVISGQGGPGSCVIDVRKATYAAFPTVASICAAAKPTVVAAHKSQDVTLTGWTVAVAAGDILRFVLESTSSFTDIAISLSMEPP